MRRDFESAVFGQPKDNSFSSSVNQIYQSFGGSGISKPEEKDTQAGLWEQWFTLLWIRTKSIWQPGLTKKKPFFALQSRQCPW